MAQSGLIRDSLANTFRSPWVWLLHFVGNALLFALATAWLLIPVANSFHIVFNAVSGIALAAAVLILQAGTLNYFGDIQNGGTSSLYWALRRAAKHLPAIVAVLIAFCLCWLLIDKCETYCSTVPAYVRSMMPVGLRRLITLPMLDTAFSAGIFVARWIVLPGLLLPLLLRAASGGFRAFGRTGLSSWMRGIGNVAYWLLLAGAALVGVLLTEKIMRFTPDFRTSTLHGEALSVAMRLFFAYLLGIGAWLLACSVVAGRSGAVQAKSAVGNSAA